MVNSRENWRDIPGYEGLYQASNKGRVKSLPRATTSGRVMKLFTNPRNGYVYVCLCKNNKPKGYRVHRLVMAAFYGASNLQVNHIDGDKRNNCLDNLEYCTQSENMLHAYKTGLEKALGIKIICLDDGIVYESAAAVAGGSSGAKVLMACRGLRSHYKGKHYAIYDDYLNDAIPKYVGKYKKGACQSLWR